MNIRCGTNFDVSTPNATLLEKYDTLKKSEKNGFFNHASKMLKRPNERVYQMFMNLMKDVMYDYKMTLIETITIHNFSLTHKNQMTINEIRDYHMSTTFLGKNVDKSAVYTIAYKAQMHGATLRPLPGTSVNTYSSNPW